MRAPSKSANVNTSKGGSTTALLAEFFIPGIEAADLPALFPLLRAREALSAFITLFRGGEDEVLVRLLVLREIGARAEAPRWSPQELQGHFAYLDPVKLDTVLKRLRDNELLVWDGGERLYQLSPAGRIALSALANLLELAGEADAELGFITAQIAAGQAIGKVSAEALRHLLGRLNELQNEFDQAVLGGSEFRLRRAEDKLRSVFHWIEKGTEILRAVTASGDLDTASYRTAQAIGQAQSRMLRMTGVFSRALTSLERQRVHLGESGLSSSDVTNWLRGLDREGLCALLQGALWTNPEPLFVTVQEILDVAEYELLERERQKAMASILPPPQEAPLTQRAETERLELLTEFLGTLNGIAEATPLADAVVGGGFARAAYRLSLLALMGDDQSEALGGPAAALARIPLTLVLSEERRSIDRDEVAELSEGSLAPGEPQ